MTPKQRELARHALGLPNDRKKSYRNRFYTVANNPFWRALVDAGHADADRPEKWPSSIYFRLTLAGAQMALDPGEMLDPEEFPNSEPAKTLKGGGHD